MRGGETQDWVVRYDMFRRGMLLASHRDRLRKRRVVPMQRLFATKLTPKESHAAEVHNLKFFAREAKCLKVAERARDRFADRYVQPMLRQHVHLNVWYESSPSRALQQRIARLESEHYRRLWAAEDVRWRAFRRCMRSRLPSDLRGLDMALVRDRKHAA